MTTAQQFEYLLRIGDNSLILGQRLGEWCGHGPVLEQDIAITNIALDLIGQARAWLTLAAAIEGQGRDEDSLAMLRDVGDFRNILLVEQPNEDWAYTIVRQFLFDSFHYAQLEAFSHHSTDERIRAIAAKSLKEVAYHLRFSSEWMIRLGDGTELSHQKMQAALDDLWMYGGEALLPDPLDTAAAEVGWGPDLQSLAGHVSARRLAVIGEATLQVPENPWMQRGGKQGIHSEHLGYLLADLQWMQRVYPGMEW